VQPPATDAHVDYTSQRAQGLARAMLAQSGTGLERPSLGSEAYGGPAATGSVVPLKFMRSGSPEFIFRRFMAINLWRAFSDPPQDWPLALCDGRSVDPHEGVPNPMLRVDALPDPDTIPERLPDDAARPEGFVFRFNPLHRWYYLPNMTRDEVLLLKLFDSDQSGAWRVPHASFADHSAAYAIPRESIEIRTVAYFS
jgi:hypothetical protein